MIIDEYLAQVERLAEEKLRGDSNELIWDFVAKRFSEEPSLYELVTLRSALVTDEERRDYQAYTDATGILAQIGPDRFSALMVCFDVLDATRDKRNAERCENYRMEHPLLQRIPALVDRLFKDELVCFSGIKFIPDSPHVLIGQSYAKLDENLPPEVIHFTRQHFPNAPIFARLDPFDVQDERPLSNINEEVIRPLTPAFWRGLFIHQGHRDGFNYELQRAELTRETANKYWEYEVQGIRALQGCLRRDSDDRLTLMIEEIKMLRPSAGHLMGRVIHADTYAPRGTKPEQATVEHLDLAVGYYMGEKAKERILEHLDQGKVVNAMPRVHLFRVEGVTLDALIAYCGMFFESKELLGEMIADLKR